ncbi:SusC/RagA family TonB-linked outer membrane protein [Flavisolibacter nicotianae]|uniref:SusC/RagA family TonB-linked outer membrane protein n=1 Tax=Flavisolibacter nicotianae TaxID=2364882 RepID=UPI000EAD6BD3|nr:TonB-dependent receptor [Flavisolibacter nicotianae]
MKFNIFKGKLFPVVFLFCLFLSNALFLFAQEKSSSVRGIVQGSSNEPLPGVSVTVRNAKTNFTSGTTTDSMGIFSFSRLPSGGPYSFSFSTVGYEEQTLSGYNIRDNASLSLAVKMISNTKTMEQVVVIGYGTQRKKDLTGSVGSVNSKDISEQTATRVDQALMGKLPGVQVKPVSGEPGAPPQIRIRGVGSISASVEPLYVVDGFPVASIQTLNPNDIETMDILKDASATAIYGSRGANGVVIINTKRGRAGKPVFTFSTYAGYQRIAKVPKYQSALEEAQHYYDGIRNRNIDEGNPVTGDPLKWKQAVPITILEVLAGKQPTQPGATLDFKDHVYEVIHDAPMQQYQLGASGGTEAIRYALSGEYLNQDGIVINTNFKRFSARANIDAKLSNKMTLKMNLNPSFTMKHNIGGMGADQVSADGGRGSDIIYNAIQIPMYYSLLSPDGSYFPFGDGLDAVVSTQNPLALAKEVQRNQKAMGFLGNISTDFQLLKSLRLNVMLGINMTDVKGMYFKPKLPAFNNNPAIGSDNAALDLNWLTETTLNYTKSFGKHNFGGLLGYTTQKETYESNFLTSDRYPNNLIPTLSAVSGIITNGSSDVFEWSLLSYLGRFNYNYNNRYYLTTSIRRDGSSRFGSDNKYGVFPSAALAWRISDEQFLKWVPFLTDMKLRFSYGETGNNNIGNYEQYATINYEKYVFGNNAAGGYAPARLDNPALTWEKQKSFNGGVDVKLFNNRIGITVDHYSSKNYDLLLNVNVPAITGFTTALQNIGEVQNQGWEFAFNTVNFKNKFEWTTDFNFSTNKGKVIKLGPQGDPIINGGNITMIGQPVGMFYGWIADGIFKTQAELAAGPIWNPGARDQSRVGDVRFKDISGPNGKPDGVINSFDKTIIGSPYPDVIFGMTNRFAYKNISLSVSLQGVQGNKVLDLQRGQSANNRARFRQYGYMNNYWKSEQEPGDGKTPRPNDTPTGNWRGEYSTLWLDDASYVRINNINLSYMIPDRLLRKAGIGSARVYATATNPFLFTHYVGFNPDVSRASNPLTPGVSNYDFPTAKSIVLGVNLSF